MDRKEFQKPTHYNLQRNTSCQSKSQSTNPEKTLDPQLTLVHAPSQLSGPLNTLGINPMTPLFTNLTPEFLQQSDILTQAMKRNHRLKPLEYALPESQRQLIFGEPTIEISSIDIKIPIIGSHNYHITNILQGITNPSQLNFEEYLSPGGGRPPIPLDFLPDTPSNPFEGESSKQNGHVIIQ
jgi:hypothetical protein